MTTTELCARTGVPKVFCTCVACQPPAPLPEEPDPADEVIYETPRDTDLLDEYENMRKVLDK